MNEEITRCETGTKVSRRQITKTVKISEAICARVRLKGEALSTVRLTELTRILDFSVSSVVSSKCSCRVSRVRPLELRSPRVEISIPALGLGGFQGVVLCVLRQYTNGTGIKRAILCGLLCFSSFGCCRLCRRRLSKTACGE